MSVALSEVGDKVRECQSRKSITTSFASFPWHSHSPYLPTGP